MKDVIVPGSPSNRRTSTKLRDSKRRTTSSRRWLLRQLNDPYVHAAQRDGYRSRAAYKLIQLDEKYKIFRKKQRIVDLGCAPGGWLQVALAHSGHTDTTGGIASIVGVDLQAVDPLAGVALIQGDFLEPSVVETILATLNGQADVVLSDMAAAASGHPATDHLKIMALLEAALDFSIHVLAPGGTFVAKVLQGGTEKQLLLTLKKLFTHVHHAKPDASRKDSAEMYVVALGFKDNHREISSHSSCADVDIAGKKQ